MIRVIIERWLAEGGDATIEKIMRDLRREALGWTFSLILAVVGLSFGALAIGTGYGSYDTIWGGRFRGFRGVFSHPQTMGVMACLLAVYVTALLLFVQFFRPVLAQKFVDCESFTAGIIIDE